MAVKHVSTFQPYWDSLYTWLEIEEIPKARNNIGKKESIVMAVRLNSSRQRMFCFVSRKHLKLADKTGVYFLSPARL